MAKANRIFIKSDTDGGGELDKDEFKMALFACDPLSGNTLGFNPSSLLSPRDAFDLFDEQRTGQINELVFADVLEYLGLDVPDGTSSIVCFEKTTPPTNGIYSDASSNGNDVSKI